MPLITMEGTFEDGKVMLQETPANVQRARVLVTFLPSNSTPENNGSAASNVSEEERQAAVHRLLHVMKEGIHFGGPPYLRREEIYDPANRRQR